MNRLKILFLISFFTIICKAGSVPSINFVYVPPYGSFQDLHGTTLNANPDEFSVDRLPGHIPQLSKGLVLQDSRNLQWHISYHSLRKTTTTVFPLAFQLSLSI